MFSFNKIITIFFRMLSFAKYNNMTLPQLIAKVKQYRNNKSNHLDRKVPLFGYRKFVIWNKTTCHFDNISNDT